VVVERGWVFVTQDKRIRSRPAERLALIEYGVRTFSIASTANLSSAVTLQVLQAAKARIDEALVTTPAPFVIAIYKDGSTTQLDLG
jgi:hypothetical protein